MLIFTSNKLSAFVGSVPKHQPDAPVDGDFREYWNAMLFPIDRRKCILLTNKKTLFSIVLLGVFKKDMNSFPAIFFETLIAQLKAESLYTTKEETMLTNTFKEVQFVGTDNDRKVIGSMNDFIYQLKLGIKLKSSLLETVDSVSCGVYLNSIPMGLTGYSKPRDAYLALRDSA